MSITPQLAKLTIVLLAISSVYSALFCSFSFSIYYAILAVGLIAPVQLEVKLYHKYLQIALYLATAVSLLDLLMNRSNTMFAFATLAYFNLTIDMVPTSSTPATAASLGATRMVHATLTQLAPNQVMDAAYALPVPATVLRSIKQTLEYTQDTVYVQDSMVLLQHCADSVIGLASERKVDVMLLDDYRMFGSNKVEQWFPWTVTGNCTALGGMIVKNVMNAKPGDVLLLSLRAKGFLPSETISPHMYDCVLVIRELSTKPSVRHMGDKEGRMLTGTTASDSVYEYPLDGVQMQQSMPNNAEWLNDYQWVKNQLRGREVHLCRKYSHDTDYSKRFSMHEQLDSWLRDLGCLVVHRSESDVIPDDRSIAMVVTIQDTTAFEHEMKRTFARTNRTHQGLRGPWAAVGAPSIITTPPAGHDSVLMFPGAPAHHRTASMSTFFSEEGVHEDDEWDIEYQRPQSPARQPTSAIVMDKWNDAIMVHVTDLPEYLTVRGILHNSKEPVTDISAKLHQVDSVLLLLKPLGWRRFITNLATKFKARDAFYQKQLLQAIPPGWEWMNGENHTFLVETQDDPMDRLEDFPALPSPAPVGKQDNAFRLSLQKPPTRKRSNPVPVHAMPTLMEGDAQQSVIRSPPDSLPLMARRSRNASELGKNVAINVSMANRSPGSNQASPKIPPQGASALSHLGRTRANSFGPESSRLSTHLEPKKQLRRSPSANLLNADTKKSASSPSIRPMSPETRLRGNTLAFGELSPFAQAVEKTQEKRNSLELLRRNTASVHTPGDSINPIITQRMSGLALPVASPGRISPTKLPLSLSGGSGGSGDTVNPHIRILIVEDNPINRRILCQFFKKKGIAYEEAKDGQEAIQKWSQGHFHVILMDLQMPVMDGLEATKEIRRLEKDKRQTQTSVPDTPLSEGKEPFIHDGVDKPPLTRTLSNVMSRFKPSIIVALTASSHDKDRDAAISAGCNDFLTKPVQLSWLEQKIAEWGSMQALIDIEGWRRWKGSG